MDAAIEPATRRTLGVGIVGPGRLGAALAAALVAAGYERVRVARLPGRDPAAGARLADALGLPPPASPADVAGACRLVLLTAPDAAIRAVADAWPAVAGSAVVHCSGAVGLDALAAPAAAGAAVGTLHPLQTFPAGEPPAEAARRFRGVVCGIEAGGTGARALGATLEALAADLGATSVRLEGVDRAGYHAAAVLASNDVVALMAAAARAWTLAGLPEDAARAALAPLMVAAVENVRTRPLARALTGPLARGDVDTVARHLEALAAAPDLRELYRRLALELLALDLGHVPATRDALRALLDAGEAAPRD